MSEVEIQKLLDLPPNEKAEIARRLLESLEPGPVPAWHLAILRERLAEADANPEAGISWEQVKAELWPAE
jgi:putative addiction module component (TIGR02574 family)